MMIRRPLPPTERTTSPFQQPHGRWNHDSHEDPSPFKKHSLLVFILLAFISGFFLGEKESATPTSAASQVAEKLWGNHEGSITELLGKMSKVRRELETRLIQDEFGDFYGRLFADNTAMRHIFGSSQASKARLQRRLITKILTKLQNPHAHVNFIWATAGDSSAAGHGNLFNQSYSAILEDTVEEAFSAVGIDFSARNYGIGWYRSAPELALCMEAIYGLDVDMLYWDFRIMEEDRLQGLSLWGQRAALHPNRPILLVADESFSGRAEILNQLEQQYGAGALLMDRMAVNAILKARIPNTQEDLPPALKYLICNGALEGSIPCDDSLRHNQCEQEGPAELCLQHKYKTHEHGAGCDLERYQKSWHPGWKEHLFQGRLLGHFLLSTLEEALVQLDTMKHPKGPGKSSVRSQVLLEQLQQQDDLDVLQFQNSVIPMTYTDADNETVRVLTPSLLYRKPAICHTALLPSQSRYLGLATMSHKRGDETGGYDVGQNKILAKPVGTNGDMLPLAYDSSDRHARCSSLKIDHRDYFYLKEGDGWLRALVPNTGELQTYRRPNVMSEGIILVCLQLCPLNRCSDDYVGFILNPLNGKDRGRIQMRVDGKPVWGVRQLDGCYVLEGDNGIQWGSGRGGQYEIEMKLDVPQKGLEHSVKISSIVVF